MDMDVMKVLGYGEYPDWRWRCIMRNIKRIRQADTPAEYFTGPGEEALLADETITQFAFPHLKRCLHPEAGHDMPEERMLAMKLALGAANEELVTFSCDSLSLEAGVFGGRAQGNLLVEPREFTPLAQSVYERLFYDVRPFLADAASICRLIFRDKERQHSRGAYDLVCKVTAFALGFDEYHLWREGSPSSKVKTLHSAMNAVLRYLSGLQLLGIDEHDDMEKAFIHFFSALPEILARDKSETCGERGYHGYTSGEMTAITEMIPKAESIAV